MTDLLSQPGHPFLEMASHSTPYRTVLAPLPGLGIEWRQAGTLVATALRDFSPSSQDGTAVVRPGSEHTVFARVRLLEGSEVGVDHPVTDRASRPVLVTEAVLFAGRVTGDPEVVLRAAQSQFGRAIWDYWHDAAAFNTPRFAEPVDCVVAPGGPAEDRHEPAVSHPRSGTGPGPDELPAGLAGAVPTTPDPASTDAAPPAPPPRRPRLLPVLVAVLLIAAAGLVAVLLLAG